MTTLADRITVDPEVLGTAWPTVLLMLERGEPLVEVGDRPR